MKRFFFLNSHSCTIKLKFQFILKCFKNFVYKSYGNILFIIKYFNVFLNIIIYFKQYLMHTEAFFTEIQEKYKKTFFTKMFLTLWYILKICKTCHNHPQYIYIVVKHFLTFYIWQHAYTLTFESALHAVHNFEN